MQHISDCQPWCAHKDSHNHNKADLKDMSTTAEIRTIFQLCFYGMCVLPQFFSFLKPGFTFMEIHPYLQKFSSNILELCGLYIHIIWRMLQVYKIKWVKFATNFSNLHLPKPDVHYLNIWRKINIFMFQCFGFFLSKVRVCMCLGEKPPFIWFT